MWAITTGTSSALKKKTGKESQYMVSHSELSSDPPIGSDRESGRDIHYSTNQRYALAFKLITIVFILFIIQIHII